MRKKFLAGMLVKGATKAVKKVSPEFKDAIKKQNTNTLEEFFG